jgi:hypothetical protein
MSEAGELLLDPVDDNLAIRQNVCSVGFPVPLRKQSLPRLPRQGSALLECTLECPQSFLPAVHENRHIEVEDPIDLIVEDRAGRRDSPISEEVDYRLDIVCEICRVARQIVVALVRVTVLIGTAAPLIPHARAQEVRVHKALLGIPVLGLPMLNFCRADDGSYSAHTVTA